MTDVTERVPKVPPLVEMTEFWTDLSPESRAEILSEAQLLDFAAGETIEIDFGLMISGTAAIEYMVGNGRRCLVELFHSGDLIDLCRRERRPQGRLVGLGYGSMLVLSVADFEACARHHADVLAAYRRRVEDQTGRLRDHINDLAVKTPLERIVAVLFELRRWPEARLGEATDIILPILRKDIAAYTGMKPETVSRALRRLLEAGLIRSGAHDRETITLIDPPVLRQIANGSASKTLEEGR
ncbi:MAG: Crp/Fnr family transcriptional regulator [Pseudomonadota bacterium]